MNLDLGTLRLQAPKWLVLVGPVSEDPEDDYLATVDLANNDLLPAFLEQLYFAPIEADDLVGEGEISLGSACENRLSTLLLHLICYDHATGEYQPPEAIDIDIKTPWDFDDWQVCLATALIQAIPPTVLIDWAKRLGFEVDHQWRHLEIGDAIVDYYHRQTWDELADEPTGHYDVAIELATVDHYDFDDQED